MKKRGSLCHNCRHYYTTWDKAFPFGCRAMGFKSRTAPALLTRELSGEECLSFVAKDKGDKKG
jgi:hypothetical protein